MSMLNGGKVMELERGWSLIQVQGITKLTNLLEGVPEQQQEFTFKERVALYTTVYHMSVAKETKENREFIFQELYDRSRKSLEDYINFKVLPALREKHQEFMLKALVKRWNNHLKMVRWISSVLEYLDREYVVKKELPTVSVAGVKNREYVVKKELPTVSVAGVKCFRYLVYDEMKGNVKDAVIAMIDREREGEQVDQVLLRNVVEIFVEMGMGQTLKAYEIDFETFMLGDTSTFYKRKASSWIQEDSCPDYMMKVEECLKREKKRVGHYLLASSAPKWVDKVRDGLLAQHEMQLLEKGDSGCYILLSNDKVDDLSRMYRLFCSIPKGLEPMATIFRQHVLDEGIALIKKAAYSKKAEKKETVGVQEHGLAFIREVLDLHDKYLRYVSQCFVDHKIFQNALKEAFEYFCNKGVVGSTSAELLASFSDDLLKKGGSKKLCDENMEETLEKVANLLAHIIDKDLFGELYKKKLARRLLFEKSTSIHHEWSILTKLRQLCGGQFTSKMIAMVRDLEVASDNHSKFEEYLTMNPNLDLGLPLSNLDLGLPLSVSVLNTGMWPSYKMSNLALPPEMVKCVEVYTDFYKSKRPEWKNRKLSWIYSLGTCKIMGKFDAKPIELTVTTYQAAVLLLFNDDDKLSYDDVKTKVNLIDEDVVRLLHSLSCAKYKILNKDPNTKTIGQNDLFELNTKFTVKMRRITILMPPVDEKKVTDNVIKDRRPCIDATIVRIMKSQKELVFHQLVTACIEQLRGMFQGTLYSITRLVFFVYLFLTHIDIHDPLLSMIWLLILPFSLYHPDDKMIKKQVENLITRKYLARDTENPSLFKYIP